MQKSLLLSYRDRVSQSSQFSLGTLKYNLVLGLWEQESSFMITSLLQNSSNNYGETLITKTREGIDQSEGSA